MILVILCAALIALCGCSQPLPDDEPEILATIAHNESVAVDAEGVAYSLYITAGRSLLSVRTGIAGARPAATR